MKKRGEAAGPRVVGQFTLEVLADGTFKWHFNDINPIALLGMLDCATHELREKMRAEETAPRGG